MPFGKASWRPSAIWTVEGLCAFVETTTDGEQRPLSLDIEPDCDHERAFVAMAREAVDGCVDLLDARAAEEGGMFRRIHRRDVPRKEWFAESFGVGRTKAERTRALGFGRPVAKHRLTWAKAATKKGGHVVW